MRYDRHLGDEAPVDRACGPRNVTQVPQADLVAASRMLDTLTAFLLKAREAEEADGPASSPRWRWLTSAWRDSSSA